jgi:hypothetical protein
MIPLIRVDFCAADGLYEGKRGGSRCFYGVARSLIMVLKGMKTYFYEMEYR